MDIKNTAVAWVKGNSKQLFDELTVRSGYTTSWPELEPAATFMAGTPGAGKTELSKRFIEQFSVRPLRIDADEFRALIPGYNGANSDDIQEAATLAVNKMLDIAFRQSMSLLLDTTFAYKNALMNLKRAARRYYSMQIFFIYQDPIEAWRFTKIREKVEGRVVPTDAFIRSYFDARTNVQKAKQEFGSRVTLTLIIKDYQKGTEAIYPDINEVDRYIGDLYNESDLKGILK